MLIVNLMSNFGRSSGSVRRLAANAPGAVFRGLIFKGLPGLTGLIRGYVILSQGLTMESGTRNRPNFGCHPSFASRPRDEDRRSNH